MKKLFRKEVIIGACVLLALAFLFVGIDYLKGINVFKAANYYYATYTNVQGLAVSAPVTVNGFKVGLVRDIQYEFNNPGHVKVELSLDKKLKVPRDTKALLVSDLLGTASIELKFSSHPDYHNVGDELIAEVPSGMMDAVSTDLLPAVSSILPKVDSLMTSINALAGDPALLEAVRRLGPITANLEQTTRALNRSVQALPPMMSSLQTVGVNAEHLTANLDSLTYTLNQAPIDETLQNLAATTQSLKELTAQLNNPNSSLGLLMNDRKLYDGINQVIDDLDSIMVDLKRRPKHYIPPIKIF
ncbi:MAG: MlaD family protein [Bacteroidales bacterium]|nr:MlaD family protein [Bacteroidales bacterium]